MIIRPLIKSDLMSLLQFTTQGPLELFTSDLIPEVWRIMKQIKISSKRNNFSKISRTMVVALNQWQTIIKSNENY